MYKGVQSVIFSAVSIETGEVVAVKASHKLEDEDKNLLDMVRDCSADSLKRAAPPSSCRHESLRGILPRLRGPAVLAYSVWC